MKGEIIKIKFLGEYAFFSESIKVKICDLFSEDSFMSKQTSYSESFLEVKIIDYSLPENKMFVEIISYNRKKCHFNHRQKNLSLIKTVTVRSSDTMKIIRMFREGDGQTFTSIHNIDRTQLLETNHQSKNIIADFNTIEKKTEKIEVSEIVQIPFKKLSFEFGYVSFTKWIDKLHKEIRFEIKNFEIIEEYDAIKNYFSNVLKKKKIKVFVKIVAIDGIINEVSATSNDIDKIDENLIENVKFEFVRKTIKKKIEVEIDKTVFTMEEYFDAFSDEKFKSNTFFENETDFFNDLIKISNTKHYHNLRYLSSKHAHKIMKLRFVHKPFSFIFLIEGDKNFHIIWETLDTKEATYVWHLEKDIKVLKLTIKKLEDIINTIKIEGKLAYINYNEDKFVRIYHDYSNFNDGYNKWKAELKSILT